MPPVVNSDELPDYLKVPESLKTHPELLQRGLALDQPLNIGSAHATSRSNPPHPVVKILNPANEEQAIIERLQHDMSPRNHVIPCEIIRSDPTLLVMPYLCDVDWPFCDERNPVIKLRTLLKVFHQIAEGIDHLHGLRLAHLDLYFGNMMVAVVRTQKQHPRTKAERVYIIDFDRSRQLELGPGRQSAITLPSTQIKPPPHMMAFDPYSWDVYCMGKLFDQLTKEAFYQSSPPRFLLKLSQWVIGNERGCSTVCHCRPTARRVHQVLTVLGTVLGWLMILFEFYGKIAVLICALRSRSAATMIST